MNETTKLVAELVESPDEVVPEPTTAPLVLTWRERLWLVPAETRLGVREVSEALGRSRSWLYKHIATVPHRKLDAELTFLAGELRAWIRDAEETVRGGRSESTVHERHITALHNPRPAA